MKQPFFLLFFIALMLWSCYPAVSVPLSPANAALATVSTIPAPVATPAGIKSRYKFTSNYTLQEERILGPYAVRLWHDGASSFPYDTIATIAAVGQPLLQVDYASGFDELTGQDILGDGDPDVIVKIHAGQGDCCYGTVVIDLGSPPRTALDIRNDACHGSFADLDGDGVYEYIGCDEPFPRTYCRNTAAVKVIYSYRRDEGYFPASPRFKAQYAAGIRQHTALAEQAKPGGLGEQDGSNKCAVLPLVLDYLYAGQPNEAWFALARYYTSPDAAQWRAEIETAVSRSPRYVAR